MICPQIDDSWLMRVEGNAIVLQQKSNHSDRRIKLTKLEKFMSYDVGYNCTVCKCYGGELKEDKIKSKRMI